MNIDYMSLFIKKYCNAMLTEDSPGVDVKK